MITYLNSYAKTKIIVLLLLLLFLCVSSAHGSAMTTAETEAYKKIPMSQWNELITLWNEQSRELNLLNEEFRKVKKPSAELQQQLKTAQELLKKSQEELKLAKDASTQLSKDMEELRISSATLKKQIDKERRVQRRQLWQNRFWCLLIGTGIGIAASR